MTEVHDSYLTRLNRLSIHQFHWTSPLSVDFPHSHHSNAVSHGAPRSANEQQSDHGNWWKFNSSSSWWDGRVVFFFVVWVWHWRLAAIAVCVCVCVCVRACVLLLDVCLNVFPPVSPLRVKSTGLAAPAICKGIFSSWNTSARSSTRRAITCTQNARLVACCLLPCCHGNACAIEPTCT